MESTKTRRKTATFHPVQITTRKPGGRLPVTFSKKKQRTGNHRTVWETPVTGEQQ